MLYDWFSKKSRWLMLLLITVAAAGCGSGDGPISVSDSPQTGLLLDGATAGVAYHTSTLSGVTNEQGEFQYNYGETVTFTIGDIVLGAVLGNGIITPVELTGSVDPTDQAVVNMLVFLQSLDNDGDHSNGINISTSAQSLAEGLDINFEAADFSTQVADVVTQMTGGANTVVSEQDAVDNFYDTFSNNGGAGTFSFVFNRGNSSSGGSSSGGSSGDAELLTNVSFDSGVTDWTGNAANVVDDSGNNVNYADVQSAGNPYDVNL
ncbi:MAG: hypothetical protein GY744_17375, partial [Gammaproteobacteria bacterium]|nr:hypothetical protein [Gammaproteobacteria bacterium]